MVVEKEEEDDKGWRTCIVCVVIIVAISVVQGLRLLSFGLSSVQFLLDSFILSLLL